MYNYQLYTVFFLHISLSCFTYAMPIYLSTYLSIRKIWIKNPINLVTQIIQWMSTERSGYDKGQFWPNLRNCLYRYNIKHNHWKVRQINFWMISHRRRCQLIIGNSNMVVLFYISCIVFSTKCYILYMYTLQMILQCSKVAYNILV